MRLRIYIIFYLVDWETRHRQQILTDMYGSQVRLKGWRKIPTTERWFMKRFEKVNFIRFSALSNFTFLSEIWMRIFRQSKVFVISVFKIIPFFISFF